MKIPFVGLLVVMFLFYCSAIAQTPEPVMAAKREELKKQMPDSVLKLWQAQDSLLHSFSYQKSIYYHDTGFIIFSGPHRICCFVSSDASDLKNCIGKIKYARFVYINSNALKDIQLEDTMPTYVKQCLEWELYDNYVLAQRSIEYFRARVTLKLPLEGLAYVPLGDYKEQGHYLQIKGKKLYLFPIFSGFVEECEDFVPLE